MVDVKKFTTLIAFNEMLRDVYYDMTDKKGINSVWDIYHIQEGTEQPSESEIRIMQAVFDSNISGNKELMELNNLTELAFLENVSKKISG